MHIINGARWRSPESAPFPRFRDADAAATAAGLGADGGERGGEGGRRRRYPAAKLGEEGADARPLSRSASVVSRSAAAAAAAEAEARRAAAEEEKRFAGAAGLHANTSLSALLLSNNGVTHEALSALARALALHGGLTELDLSVNPLCDETHLTKPRARTSEGGAQISEAPTAAAAAHAAAVAAHTAAAAAAAAAAAGARGAWGVEGISPHISPISPHDSPYLPVSPHQVRAARGGSRARARSGAGRRR